MEKKKFLIILLSTIVTAFLGSFIAGRVVAQKTLAQQNFIPAAIAAPEDISKQFDVMMENHQKIIDKMNKDMDAMMKQTSNPDGYFSINSKMTQGNYTAIKTEETNALYKITIS